MAAFITEECINCGACIDECPTGAIVDDEHHPEDAGIHFVKADKCTECDGDNPTKCMDACPSEAIKLV